MGYIDQVRLLALQQAPQADHYPLRGESHRPFTWHTEPLIDTEAQHLSNALATHGITPQVGLEVEFLLNEARPISPEALELRCTALIADATPEMRPYLTKFGPRELIAYELTQKNPQTQKLLQRLFDPELEGYGYYDGKDTLEMKLHHTDPVALLQGRREVLSQLYATAQNYGYTVSGVTEHVNFSFTKNGKNLLLDSHPEFDETTGQIVSGVGRSLYDAYAAVTAEPSFGVGDKIFIRPDRFALVRMSDDRFEVRPGSTKKVHVGFLVSTVLAGALYGLERGEDPQTLKTEIHAGGEFHYPKDQYATLAHVLSGSIIRDDGSLHLPGEYMNINAYCLFQELGAPQTQAEYLLKYKCTPVFRAYYASLVEFIEGARITTDAAGSHITWPRNREDGTYAIEGQTAHNPIIVDVDRLSDSLRCFRTSKRHTITKGYDPGAASPHESHALLDTRIERMRSSKVLQHACTPEFRDAVDVALDALELQEKAYRSNPHTYRLDAAALSDTRSTTGNALGG